MAGLNGKPVEIGASALEALSTSLTGSVLLPADSGFEAAVRIWNGLISKAPALVVQPASTEDVRKCVDFARTRRLLLSVKGGGCHIAGISLADEGMTLDMSRLRTVEVNAERLLARVGPGCLIADVDQATGRHGLATALGWGPDTGVAGLTLGGGFGCLTPRFGASLDNLQEAEVVTADGHVRRAASDENQDLFWALRGGGGNFGVVTRFTFRLHALRPQITGGLVVWDAEQAREVFDVYREVVETASRDLSVAMIMRLAPQAPFIPQQWHGKLILGALVCHIGDHAQAAKDLAPLRRTGRPVADTVMHKPYVEQQALSGRMQPPKGMHNYSKSEFLARLDGGMIEALQQQAELITSPLSLQLFQLGGALRDQELGATSFANRDAAYNFVAAGSWSPESADAETHLAWVRSAWEAIRPYSTGGNYINVQTADEDDSRIREAYRQNLERLKQVKAAYDPDNFFRVNRNIQPAA